jgi:hypothetical protein
MVGVTISRDRLAYLLDCLANGKGIKPPPGGWSTDDMLMLAGACRFGVMTHGPPLYSPEQLLAMTGERREALEEDFAISIEASVEWCAHVASLIWGGEYDQAFEPEHKAIVSTSGAGQRELTPVAGFKNAPAELR